jgi:hypothetical protein
MALVFIEDSYFGFDHCPKSTRDILRYRYWSYLHKVISRRLQILKSLVWRYFYFPTVFLVLMTSTRITLMFSTIILYMHVNSHNSMKRLVILNVDICG